MAKQKSSALRTTETRSRNILALRFQYDAQRLAFRLNKDQEQLEIDDKISAASKFTAVPC